MKANRTRRGFSPCCVAAAALLLMGSDIMRGLVQEEQRRGALDIPPSQRLSGRPAERKRCVSHRSERRRNPVSGQGRRR